MPDDRREPESRLPPRPRAREADETPRHGIPRGPTDAPVQSFKPLPEGASLEQIIHALHEGMTAYANIATGYKSELPAIREVLREIRSEMTADRLERRRIDLKLSEMDLAMVTLSESVKTVVKDVLHVTGRVTAIEMASADEISRRMTHDEIVASLPPMRRELDSVHAIHETSQRVGGAVAIEAQKIIDDPDTTLSPDVIASLVTTKVQEELAREREANQLRAAQAILDKAKADDLAADRLRDKLQGEKRERNRLLYVGIVVAIVTAIAGGVVAYYQGRLTEHATEAAERALVMPSAPVLVPVPMPTPIGTIAGPAPASSHHP